MIDALLSRMRRRYELRNSHQALYMQKLWAVSYPTGALGVERKTQTKLGNSRREKTKTKKRLFEVVAKQKKVSVH